MFANTPRHTDCRVKKHGEHRLKVWRPHPCEDALVVRSGISPPSRGVQADEHQAAPELQRESTVPTSRLHGRDDRGRQAGALVVAPGARHCGGAPDVTAPWLGSGLGRRGPRGAGSGGDSLGGARSDHGGRFVKHGQRRDGTGAVSALAERPSRLSAPPRLLSRRHRPRCRTRRPQCAGRRSRGRSRGGSCFRGNCGRGRRLPGARRCGTGGRCALAARSDLRPGCPPRGSCARGAVLRRRSRIDRAAFTTNRGRRRSRPGDGDREVTVEGTGGTVRGRHTLSGS